MDELTYDVIIKLVSTIYRKTQMYLNEQASAFGLTSGQIPFIMIVCENKQVKQHRLCELMDMNKGTVTKMLVKLERLGYVTRCVNEMDGRSFTIAPTTKAIGIYPKLQQIGNGWALKITSEMTEIERAIYFQMLEKTAVKSIQYFQVQEREKEDKQMGGFRNEV